MPSGLASGPKFRSIRGGGRYRIAPDFVETHRFVAADASGANTGINLWVVPASVNGAIFLGATALWTTAGTGNFRIKKIKAGNTSAPGAAADANNVDLTATVAVTTAANTPVDISALTASAVNVLAAGDRLALASGAGLATVAGGLLVVRLAWL